MRVRNKALIAVAFVFGVIWIIPFYWMTMTAFTEPSFVMPLWPETAFTLNNLKYVLQVVPFGQYFLNTVILVTVTFCVQFVTVTMGGYALATYRFRGQTIVYIIVFMQLIIPNDVLIIPNYITMSELKLVDTKLAIMLPFLGSAMGLFLLRQQFKTMPIALTEAARIDGCSTFRIIWNIYVPNAKTAYLAYSLVSISYHWNNYLWPLIVTNSVENRPLTVGLAIFAKSREAVMQWANICAAAFFVSAPLVILFFVFQKQFISSFVSTGIK